MTRRHEPNVSLTGELARYSETEHGREQLRSDAREFSFGFLANRHRAKAVLGRTLNQGEKTDPEKRLSPQIDLLYGHLVEMTVLQRELLLSGQRRYMLPFIDIDPKTQEMAVKVVPFASPDSISSQKELSGGIFLMRDLDAYLNNPAFFLPKAAPYVRELLKTLFHFMHWQLHRGGKVENSQGIDFPLASEMVEALEFTPSESLRDLFYRDKYGKFKKLMEGRKSRFDAREGDFRQWIQASNDQGASVDPERRRVSQVFERDLEAALVKKTDELKGELRAHLQMLDEAAQEKDAAPIEGIRAGVTDQFALLLKRRK